MKSDSRLKYCWWYIKYIDNFVICVTSKSIDTCGPYFGLDCSTSIRNYLEEQLLMVLRKDEQPEEWGSFFRDLVNYVQTTVLYAQETLLREDKSVSKTACSSNLLINFSTRYTEHADSSPSGMCLTGIPTILTKLNSGLLQSPPNTW